MRPQSACTSGSLRATAADSGCSGGATACQGRAPASSRTKRAPRWIACGERRHRVPTVRPLAGQFITLIKDSSLVALISIQELSFLAMEIAISEQRFFEVWIFTGFMYFVVCYACAWAFGRLEARMGVHLR